MTEENQNYIYQGEGEWEPARRPLADTQLNDGVEVSRLSTEDLREELEIYEAKTAARSTAGKTPNPFIARSILVIRAELARRGS